MTPEERALDQLVGLLEELRIPYMVTGSLASSHHGRPRSTHDIDVVLDPSAESLERLVERLAGAGFYVDADVARDALRRRRQFNAIEMTSASKLDLIIRKERPFSIEELARRRTVELPGARAMEFASPEDVVLSKLEWARKAGGSERQLADVRGIVEVNGAGLDRAYIERWARDLGVLDLWLQLGGG